MLLLCLYQDIENGQDRLCRPAIDDALPPDLQHVDLRLHPEVFLGLGSLEELLAHERLPREGGLNMKPAPLTLFFHQFRHFPKYPPDWID